MMQTCPVFLATKMRYLGVEQGGREKGSKNFFAAKLGARAGYGLQRKPKIIHSFFVFSLGSVQNLVLALMIFILPEDVGGIFLFLEGFRKCYSSPNSDQRFSEKLC